MVSLGCSGTAAAVHVTRTDGDEQELSEGGNGRAPGRNTKQIINMLSYDKHLLITAPLTFSPPVTRCLRPSKCTSCIPANVASKREQGEKMS